MILTQKMPVSMTGCQAVAKQRSILRQRSFHGSCRSLTHTSHGKVTLRMAHQAPPSLRDPMPDKKDQTPSALTPRGPRLTARITITAMTMKAVIMLMITSKTTAHSRTIRSGSRITSRSRAWGSILVQRDAGYFFTLGICGVWVDLSSRYYVVSRETLFQSPVALTPYQSEERFDGANLGAIIDDAYHAAGLHAGQYRYRRSDPDGRGAAARERAGDRREYWRSGVANSSAPRRGTTWRRRWLPTVGRRRVSHDEASAYSTSIRRRHHKLACWMKGA